MLKFLIILILILYLIFKVGGFFFKMLFMGGQEAQRPFQPKDSNVNVRSQEQTSAQDKHFRGEGEYVDYEEVD